MQLCSEDSSTLGNPAAICTVLTRYFITQEDDWKAHTYYAFVTKAIFDLQTSPMELQLR